jgi:hypothetical protein
LSYSFFGLQVAFKHFHRDPLRGQLHELLKRGADKTESPADKQRFWKRFSAQLNTAMPLFEYGDWELVRGGKAEKEFNDWASQIEGSMATLAEEVGPKADEAARVSEGPSYVLATMMVLVDQGSNADQTLGEWCNVPESEWLTRQTFGRLISIFTRLNFAYVQSDAVYLVPGQDADGFSAEELVSEECNYLQPLT